MNNVLIREDGMVLYYDLIKLLVSASIWITI